MGGMIARVKWGRKFVYKKKARCRARHPQNWNSRGESRWPKIGREKPPEQHHDWIKKKAAMKDCHGLEVRYEVLPKEKMGGLKWAYLKSFWHTSTPQSENLSNLSTSHKLGTKCSDPPSIYGNMLPLPGENPSVEPTFRVAFQLLQGWLALVRSCSHSRAHQVATRHAKIARWKRNQIRPAESLVEGNSIA